MTPESIIIAFGFHRAGSCSCGGTHNDLYQKKVGQVRYILYFRKKRHVFKMKQGREQIIGVTSLNNLETELKKLFPHVAIPKEKEVSVLPGRR